MNFGSKKQAFTLVELIVVITILAVLGTIAIIAFSGYSKNARDSARISDIANIKKSLELWILQSGTYPTPSTPSADITFSGSTVWTQGTFGDSVLSTVGKLEKKPIDPVYDVEYTYSVTASKKEYQIGAILEKDMASYSPVSQTYASSSSTAYVVGNYNGIISTIYGTPVYILAIPSIILSDLSNTELDGISEYSLVYNNKANLPATYAGKNLTMTGYALGFVPKIVWSGTGFEDLNNQTEFQKLVSALQQAYTGSLFTSLPEYTSIATTGAYSVEAMSSIKSVIEVQGKKELNNINVIAQNLSSCSTSLPSCNGTSCELTYNPSTENQDWVKGGNSCSYSCINDYTGDTCQTPPPSPSCGSDNGKNLIVTPSNLCTSGTPSSVTDGGIGSTYTWSCSRNGFTSASCSANHISNPFTMVGGQITGYNVAIGGTNVVIPETINGVTITSIGNSAFSNNQITSLSIPSSVTSIGEHAFYNNNLTTLVIPNSVTSIGREAFRFNKLNSLTLPSSITYIGYYTFLDQSGSVGSVYGPNSGYVFTAYQNNTNAAFDKTKLIGYYYSCTAQTCESSPYTFDESSATITAYNATLGGTTPTIPSTINGITVTRIGASAFKSKGLTSITLPNTITGILSNAFESNQLTSISIPTSVTSIGDYAFSSNQITSLTLPNSITSIGNGTFIANQISSLILPNNITSIGNSTFYNNKLTSVTIPSSVTSISDYAFEYNQITSLSIPSSVTSIGREAFRFNKLNSLTLPSSITYIGYYTFLDQSGSVGSVYGPNSGYVFTAYQNNTNAAFDKTKLANYVGQ